MGFYALLLRSTAHRFGQGLYRCVTSAVVAAWLVSCGLAWAAEQQPADKPYEPRQGQPGKDVMWIPTPDDMVGKMLTMAKVTPRDFVIDLGSGDGRNVIAAARRGAHALGVEYNPELVEFSKRTALAAGVAAKATFVQGDMFEADISKATVMILFLITDNLRKLTPRLLNLRPGTRVVSNTFEIPGWSADQTYKLGGDCITWCTAFLYIVPTKVAGKWQLPQGTLTLEQTFQTLNGTLEIDGQSLPIKNGRLNGSQIQFIAGSASYTARVSNDTIKGSVKGGAVKTWTAARTNPQ